MTEIITYESLYEILRKEKYSQELQKLDKDFFKKVVKHIEEKTKFLESQRTKDSIFSAEIEKTQKQLDNVKKIIREIYEKREAKIMQIALLSSRANTKEDLTAFLPEEKKMYKQLADTLLQFREEILVNVLASKLPTAKEKPKLPKSEDLKEETKLLRILHPIPKFIASDLKVYGPFDEEDIINIQKRSADVLLRKGRAEEIKSEIA